MSEIDNEMLLTSPPGPASPVCAEHTHTHAMASEKDKLLAAESGVVQDSHRDVRDEQIRTYWWRWIVLIVYVMNITIFNAGWFTFAPIADVVTCYYNVSTFWTNSLTLVAMVVYIIFVLPGAWCLERLGLRTTTIIASSTTAVGTALKFAGVGKIEGVCEDKLDVWYRG